MASGTEQFEEMLNRYAEWSNEELIVVLYHKTLIIEKLQEALYE